MKYYLFICLFTINLTILFSCEGNVSPQPILNSQWEAVEWVSYRIKKSKHVTLLKINDRRTEPNEIYIPLYDQFYNAREVGRLPVATILKVWQEFEKQDNYTNARSHHPEYLLLFSNDNSIILNLYISFSTNNFIAYENIGDDYIYAAFPDNIELTQSLEKITRYGKGSGDDIDNAIRKIRVTILTKSIPNRWNPADGLCSLSSK